MMGHRRCHTPANMAGVFLPTLTLGAFQNLLAPLYCCYIHQTPDRCAGVKCIVLLILSKYSNRSGTFWTNAFLIGSATQNFPWIGS